MPTSEHAGVVIVARYSTASCTIPPNFPAGMQAFTRDGNQMPGNARSGLSDARTALARARGEAEVAPAAPAFRCPRRNTRRSLAAYFLFLLVQFLC